VWDQLGIATRFILQEGNEFPNDGGDKGTQQKHRE